jgi:predicted flap endonuclease-1-like 5' DNA nuclease
MTDSRSGGCGCGGAHASGGCGCGEKGARTVHGGCACAEPERCGVPCLERPVYSAGQLLTADALRLGQRYVGDRLALRRYVDGVGIVCGLHVRCDPEHPGWIIVDPGWAVDACGHDVALCEPVRFDLCGAIAECPRPAPPCGDDVVPLPRVEVGPVDHGRVAPGEARLETRGPVLQGRVVDRASGAALAGATVQVDGTTLSTRTDAQGVYRLQPPAGGRPSVTVSASVPGYRVSSHTAELAAGRLTEASFAMVPLPRPLPRKEPPPLRTYVLRAEAVWEGREPVAVVTRPGSADPRPECRDSREAVTVRLCVQPLQEQSAEARAAERRDRFRRLGQALFERLAMALETGDRRAERVADTLLRWVREYPPRSLCGTVALLCELRRLIRGEQPKCPLPAAVYRTSPEYALAQVVAQLVDDLREGFLSLPCDDCAPHPGVRLAHVVVDERLARCEGTACHLAAIDTHPPAREALHPAGSWWRGDRVALYDAYFLPVDEAGVLLTSRGLRAFWRDAGQSGYTGELPARVRDWLGKYGGTAALRQLGVYQQSELYTWYGAEVVMWTVEGRVVSIEPWDWYVERIPQRFCMETYVGRPLREPEQQQELSKEEVSWEIKPTPETEQTRRPAPVEGTGPALEDAEAVARPEQLAALDPAPLKELIRGIGPKTEAEMFRFGIRTLGALAKAEYERVHDTLSGNLFLTPELFADLREQACEYLDGKRTVSAVQLRTWAEAARKRLAALEGRAQ